MSITATNNPYPDSPDPSPSKLDRGGYEGTAETLDNKIDSTLAEAELLINNFLTDSTLIGNPSIAIPTEITGNAHCIGVGPGTYAFWGGMVIPANNIGTLKRVDGVYSVNLTAFADVNKILPWQSIPYAIGSQTNKDGIDWYLPTTAALSTDVPGTSSKWVERTTRSAKLHLEKLGLINRDAFFISANAYKISNAILKLNIEVDDSIATAADIRLYAMWNRSANPTNVMIFKNYTTGSIISFTKTSGVNTGILNMSKNSSDGLIKISVTVNLDEIPYADSFNFYQDNTTASAKFSFTKFSEANVKNIDLAGLNSNVNELVAQALGYDNTLVFINESINGYYNKSNGVFAATAGHRSRKYTIGGNRNIYATGTVAGSVIALACYYTSADVFISSEFTSAVHDPRIYNRQKLTVPPTCGIIGISTVNTEAYGVIEQGIVDIVSKTEIDLSSSTKVGKKIVVFGTSIPATNYHSAIANKLGCTIYNEAIGSSCVRIASSVTGTMKGLYYEPALRSLGHTIAEKQSIIDHWTTGLDVNGNILGGGTYGWRDLMLGSPPSVLSSYASDATILGWSYEKKLVEKYLDTTHVNFIASPDVFLLDHGHNDLVVTGYDVDSTAAISIPAIRNNRAYFNGAMNYLIDVILSYNPRAEIRFVGHYEDARKTNISLAQVKLAEYWDFPLLKLWEKLGFTQQIVPTTGYWSDAYTWIPEGGTLTNRTMTQIWMQDDLHPYSDATKAKFANVVGNFINNS